MLERTSFLLVKDYSAAKITEELGWSVFHGLDWVAQMWETRQVQSIESHDYISRNNHKDVSVVHEMAVLSVVRRHMICADGQAVNLHYRGSSESVAPSQQFSAASPVLSGLEDIYGDIFADDWEVDAEDGGAAMSAYWKELSVFGLMSTATVPFS